MCHSANKFFRFFVVYLISLLLFLCKSIMLTLHVKCRKPFSKQGENVLGQISSFGYFVKEVIPCARILNVLIPRKLFDRYFIEKTIRAKEPEKLGNLFFCKEDALTSSFNIPNALKQFILVMSVFHVECDLVSGYLVHPAM